MIENFTDKEKSKWKKAIRKVKEDLKKKEEE